MTKHVIRLGLVGFGNIGHAIADILPPNVTIETVLVRKVRPELAIRQSTDVEQFLIGQPDIIIECAGQAALMEHAGKILAMGLDLVPASIGALADEQFMQQVKIAAARGHASLHVPSGALTGVDGLGAASLIGVHSVLYRGTAPFYAWDLKADDAEDANSQIEIFSGTAREACLQFPKNANVAAAVALSGLGFDRTQVQLVADRTIQRNRHEIIAEGAFGDLHTRVDCAPISEGKRSSKLIAGSLLHTAIRAISTIKL